MKDAALTATQFAAMVAVALEQQRNQTQQHPSRNLPLSMTANGWSF